METTLNSYPHIDTSKPLMVVVDTSVFCHKLHQSSPFDVRDRHFEGYIKAQITWLLSGAWLGHELRPLVSKYVFAVDSKPYWRTEWLADIRNTLELPRKGKTNKKRVERCRELLEDTSVLSDDEVDELQELIGKLNVKYKAGRKLPEYKFTKTKKLVLKYLEELGQDLLASSGYEADDQAAALVQTNTLNGNPWNIILYTVDTDWLGLVNPNVTWVCMSGFAPVIRDSLEVVNTWAASRLKCTLGTWRDIWDVKGQKGDASDNLPPSDGLLLPVIDLLNPPVDKRLWLTKSTLLNAQFQPVDPAFTLEQALAAKTYLIATGTMPVLKVLPGEQVEPQRAPVFLDVPGESVEDMLSLLDSF